MVQLCLLCGSPRFYTILAELQGGSGAAHVIDECRMLISKGQDDWLDIMKLIMIITEYVSAEQALQTLIKLSQVVCL